MSHEHQRVSTLETSARRINDYSVGPPRREPNIIFTGRESNPGLDHVALAGPSRITPDQEFVHNNWNPQGQMSSDLRSFENNARLLDHNLPLVSSSSANRQIRAISLQNGANLEEQPSSSASLSIVSSNQNRLSRTTNQGTSTAASASPNRSANQSESNRASPNQTTNQGTTTAAPRTAPVSSTLATSGTTSSAKLSCAYADEYDHPLRENIKIVVVGDSGSGKSKLAFSQACKRTFSEKELNKSCVPTIWAIDQYKHRRDVQELAQCCIDGAHVSVRIWDTFGDHSKDRNFAYQNADVVVLCFSLCDRKSMHNVTARWLGEIHHFLKNIPVILAGTMLDMRWKDLKSQHKFQSKFNRKIQASDIINPDEARDMCENVGLPYYECTVLTGYGVSDVFENAIRAALIHKRSARMYTMNHLRKVREPLLQAPCLPPEPPYPQLPPVVQSTYLADLSSLAISEETADVVLCCGSTKLFCHKLLLVQSSGLFSVFFEQQAVLHSMLNDLSDTGGDSDLDSEHNGENRDNCGSEVGGLKRSELFLNGLPILKMNHVSDYILDNRLPNRHRVGGGTTGGDFFDDAEASSNCAQQVCVHSGIPKNHVSLLLHFVYHLQLPSKVLHCSKLELMQSAKLFKMHDLVIHLRNMSMNCENHIFIGSSADSTGKTNTRSKLAVLTNLAHYNNSSTSLNSCSSSSENNLPNIMNQSNSSVSKPDTEIENLMNVGRRQEFLRQEFQAQQLNQTGNFVFRVNGESIFVHKYILVARSKFMSSLLCGSFRESQGHHLDVSDISSEALKVVLGYLYCDQLILKVSQMDISEWCDVIEFANRLCLDRLISLVEHELVADLNTKTQPESVKDSILLIDKCNLFNAHALHKWLFTHLSHNYDFMCKNYSYLKQTMLTDETKKELLRNRWPPVWYIKEKDYYERRKRLMSKIEGNKRQMKSGMAKWWMWRKLNVL